ncbi:MAG: NusG domain II-containing protein [Clostridiales bacterium]|nr:NusG domain II-containing protein [Clostridiales bacterium]
MIKTRTWVILFCIFLLLCTGLGLFVFKGKANGAMANIYQNGECIYSIDLSAVKEEYELTVSGDGGYNVIHIKPGAICIADADCPDGICIQEGWLTDGIAPIVCLPHKLVIQIENSAAAADEEIDAVSK